MQEEHDPEWGYEWQRAAEEIRSAHHWRKSSERWGKSLGGVGTASLLLVTIVKEQGTWQSTQATWNKSHWGHSWDWEHPVSSPSKSTRKIEDVSRTQLGSRQLVIKITCEITLCDKNSNALCLSLLGSQTFLLNNTWDCSLHYQVSKMNPCRIWSLAGRGVDGYSCRLEMMGPAHSSGACTYFPGEG